MPYTDELYVSSPGGVHVNSVWYLATKRHALAHWRHGRVDACENAPASAGAVVGGVGRPSAAVNATITRKSAVLRVGPNPLGAVDVAGGTSHRADGCGADGRCLGGG